MDLPIIFTSDCRFHNECAALKELGKEDEFTTIFVRIDRPAILTKDCHASEADWKHMEFDYQIFNDEDWDEVYKRSEEILSDVLELQACS